MSFSLQLKVQNIVPVTWELPLWELCIFLQNLQINQNYHSPCNWTDKTSCLLHGSCHYEKFVYSYKIYRQIKTTCITFVSQNIHLRMVLQMKQFFQVRVKEKFGRASDFICGWKKQNVHFKLDWNILEKVKHYSLTSKKHVLRLTDKYQIILSSKNMLKKAMNW